MHRNRLKNEDVFSREANSLDTQFTVKSIYIKEKKGSYNNYMVEAKQCHVCIHDAEHDIGVPQ